MLNYREKYGKDPLPSERGSANFKAEAEEIIEKYDLQDKINHLVEYVFEYMLNYTKDLISNLLKKLIVKYVVYLGETFTLKLVRCALLLEGSWDRK